DVIAPLYEIENGKTMRVDFQKGKRAVTGKVQIPPGPITSPFCNFSLAPLPGPPVPENLSKEEKRKWFMAWNNSPEGQAYYQREQIPTLERNPDGTVTFLCEYVPPGKYRLW